MKKKCRVYGSGGAYSYKMQDGGQKPVMTQDSQQSTDNVPGQKTASFLEKVHMNNQKAQIKNMIEQEQQRLIMAASMGMMAYGGKPRYQGGGPYFPNADIMRAMSPEYYANLNYGMPGDYNSTAGNAPAIDPSFRDITSVDDVLEKMPKLPTGMVENTPGMASQTQDVNPLSTTQENALKKMKNLAIANMAVQGGLGLMDFVAKRFEAKDIRRRQNEILNQVTDVHNIFATNERSDRGDYMVNVPGVGDFLRPDQHTRFGYGTKVAQDGLEVGDEMELSEEEIKRLIAQGYDLEYL